MMRNAHGSGMVRAAGQGWGRAPTYTQSEVGLHDGSKRPGLETLPSAGPPRDVLTVSLYPPAALQQAKKKKNRTQPMHMHRFNGKRAQHE